MPSDAVTTYVQAARPRDLPGIMRIREDNLARYAARGAPTLQPDHETILRRTQSAIESAFAKCYVALDGDTVIGCLLLRLSESPLNRNRLIAIQEVFVVDPRYRHAGIGHQLLEKGESWARENGVNAVVLAYRADEAHGDWFTAHGYGPLEHYVVKEME